MADRQHQGGLLARHSAKASGDLEGLTRAELECRGTMEPSWHTTSLPQPSLPPPPQAAGHHYIPLRHGQPRATATAMHTNTYTYPQSTLVQHVSNVSSWSSWPCGPSEAAGLSTVKQGSVSETQARQSPQQASPSSHRRPMPAAHATAHVGSCPAHCRTWHAWLDACPLGDGSAISPFPPSIHSGHGAGHSTNLQFWQTG